MIFFITTAVCVGETLYVDIDKLNLLDKLKEQFSVLIDFTGAAVDLSTVNDLETFWFYKSGLRLVNYVLASFSC